MDKFLDELTIEDLKGETQELAETIGLDAFKRLVQAYNGTGRLYTVLPVDQSVGHGGYALGDIAPDGTEHL